MVGRCTTHFRTSFGGDWDVHWGYGVLTHGHMAKKESASFLKIVQTDACRCDIQVGGRDVRAHFCLPPPPPDPDPATPSTGKGSPGFMKLRILEGRVWSLLQGCTFL